MKEKEALDKEQHIVRKRSRDNLDNKKVKEVSKKRSKLKNRKKMKNFYLAKFDL